MLALLLAVIFVAGGASRADELGQIVVRTVSCIMLIGLSIFGSADSPRVVAGPLAILAALFMLLIVQAIPLSPSLWQMLPGRELLVEAGNLEGAQPARPLAFVPAHIVNAISALVVPLGMLLLVAALTERERAMLPGVILVTGVLSALIGLLQFSGAGFDNIFINDSLGQVSGPFANRNHFALFLGIGCLVAPSWAFAKSRRMGWRAPAALGLIILFVLTILGTGSRAGLLIGTIAIVLGLVIVSSDIRRMSTGVSRRVVLLAAVGIVGTIAVLVLVSVAADRAVSIERIVQVDTTQDMRTRGLPTVLAIVGAYFPSGYGIGGFDAIFRIHEADALLKPTYFNHAHNDWLEIAMDAGLPGVMLVLAAVSWWGWASLRAWRRLGATANVTGRLGSAILLLVMLASTVDYPVRTPFIMAIAAIAAAWLAGQGRTPDVSALPRPAQHL